MKRLAWKQDLLARIAALHASRRRGISLADVLGDAAHGVTLPSSAWRQACAPSPAISSPIYRYALHDGQVFLAGG